MTTRFSSRGLWLPVGALGVAALLGCALMLSQAPIRLIVAQPASVVRAPSQPLAVPAPSAPIASNSAAVKTLPGGVSAPPAADRCTTLGMGRARALPMCAPPLPQP